MFLRKLTTGVIVAALVCSMSVPALAASGYSKDKDPGKTGADNYGGNYVPSTSSSATISSSDASSRVSDAVNSGKSSVSIPNVASVSASTVKSMFNTASTDNLTVYFDQVDNGVVTSRIYVTADVAEALDTDISLNVLVNNSSVTNFFNQYFSNNVTSVKFEQDSFGVPVAVAVKADLTGMNTDNLVFYIYDAATNTYKALPGVEYTIDANGYLRFVTEVGGNIVISEGALTK